MKATAHNLSELYVDINNEKNKVTQGEDWIEELEKSKIGSSIRNINQHRNSPSKKNL